jgi:hypothetical protein
MFKNFNLQLVAQGINPRRNADHKGRRYKKSDVKGSQIFDL